MIEVPIWAFVLILVALCVLLILAIAAVLIVVAFVRSGLRSQRERRGVAPKA